MFKTIVWATDGSELADRALDYVRELARQDGSRIVAVHANELMRGRSSGYPALADEPELEKKIRKQIEELRSVGIDSEFEIRSGTKAVATLIAEAAKDVDADLIVVATHGAGGFNAALMGSVARALSATPRKRRCSSSRRRGSPSSPLRRTTASRRSEQADGGRGLKPARRPNECYGLPAGEAAGAGVE
jgi:nucleotide-binding universal stress UspA family protein